MEAQRYIGIYEVDNCGRENFSGDILKVKYWIQFIDTFNSLEIYYNQEKECLGWLWYNGFLSDILIGTQSELEIKEFGEKHGYIKFKYIT